MAESRKRRIVKPGARVVLWTAVLLSLPGYFLTAPILYGIAMRSSVSTNLYVSITIAAYDYPSRVARENTSPLGRWYRMYCGNRDNEVLAWVTELRDSGQQTQK